MSGEIEKETDKKVCTSENEWEKLSLSEKKMGEIRWQASKTDLTQRINTGVEKKKKECGERKVNEYVPSILKRTKLHLLLFFL